VSVDAPAVTQTLCRCSGYHVLMAEFASCACVVYLRLRENYEAATDVWQQYRYPNVLPIDKPRITEEEILKLRQQALLERSATENALHRHRRTCPVCNRPAE
jgi:hypothetical protein